MATQTKTLPDDPEALKALVARLQNKINFLEEQFRLARHKQFAASTEASSGQGDLFNEAEEAVDEPSEPEDLESESETVSYSRQKPKRQPLPKDLPREEIIHDLNDEEKVCPCCDGALHKIGEERSEQLEYVPAQIKVLEHVRPKYACRRCENENIKTPILIAPVPATPIPKSIATPSLLSQIITHKYQFALPLYRQEVLFKQYGISLSRKTMSSWMIRCAELLKPIIERLKQHLKEQPVIHADETPLKVIQEEKSKSYMWLYCSGTDSPIHSDIKNIVLYDYHASRSGLCAKQYLDGYTGYLQVDGYAGYEQTESRLVSCIAHARRKFIEAQKSQKKNKVGRAQWAINQLQKIYVLERKITGADPATRFQYRLKKIKPKMDDLKKWLDQTAPRVAPQTLLGIAINYCLNQWHKLYAFLENGHLSIDNNRAERAIKPFVIGRKNWMFSNTANGANASAVLYSLIETAKANAIDPNRYLNRLLAEMPMRNTTQCLDDLMPWRVQI